MIAAAIPVGHESCRHRVYKMSCAQFDALRARASDRCEVCTATPAEAGGPLVIDHDHAIDGMAGVRGLLCARCNGYMSQVDSEARPPTPAESRYLASAWHATRTKSRKAPVPHRERAPRLRFAGYIPADTLKRARGLVAALHGTDDQVSLNEIIDAGLRRECAGIEAFANGGEQYPPADEVGSGHGGRRQRAEDDSHAAATSSDDSAI